jgi:hypothetical protein
MSSMDVILLTLLNTAVCLVLPKVLSVVLATKTKSIVSLQPARESQNTGASIPSYVDVVS